MPVSNRTRKGRTPFATACGKVTGGMGVGRVLPLVLSALLALPVVGCSSGTETPLSTPPIVETPTPKPLTVKVTKVTRSVAPGDSASITVKTVRGASCSISVVYDTGQTTAKGLGTKKADASGVVTWKWKVASNVHKQTAIVSLFCEAGGRSGITGADIVIK